MESDLSTIKFNVVTTETYSVAREIISIFQNRDWHLEISSYGTLTDATGDDRLRGIMRVYPETALSLAHHFLEGVVAKGYFENKNFLSSTAFFGGTIGDGSDPAYVCRAACFLIDRMRSFYLRGELRSKIPMTRPVEEHMTDIFLPLLRFIVHSPCSEIAPARIAFSLLQHRLVSFSEIGAGMPQVIQELSERACRSYDCAHEMPHVVDDFRQSIQELCTEIAVYEKSTQPQLTRRRNKRRDFAAEAN